MRKIYFLTILVITILVLNFVLWFSHTRVLRSTLNNVQKEGTYYRTKINYDDLYFNNFKSWNVDGVIENLTIQSDRYLNAKVIFPRINFISHPFKQHLELRADMDFFILMHEGTPYERSYKVSYPSGHPSIEVSFKSSLSEFSSNLQSNSEVTIFDEVNSIVYYDSGFVIHDMKNASDYMKIDSVKASIVNDKVEIGKNYIFALKLDGVEYLSDYKSEGGESIVDRNNKSTGINSFNADFEVLHLPKNAQKNQTLDHSQRGISDGKFDTFKFKINDISTTNERYGISVKGTMNKKIGLFIPDVDMVFTFFNYEEYINDAVDSINYAIANIPEVKGLFSSNVISKQKLQKLKVFFAKYRINEDDASFRMTSTRRDFKINEQNLLSLISEMQDVLSDKNK